MNGRKRDTREFQYGPDRNQRVIYYQPDEIRHNPVILYFHGGGFRLGDPDSMGVAADVFCGKGYRFFSIGYRLTSQDPFPAQVEDDGAAHADFSGYAVTLSEAPDFPLSTVEAARDGGRVIRALGIVLSGDSAFYADLAFELRVASDGGLSMGDLLAKIQSLAGVSAPIEVSPALWRPTDTSPVLDVAAIHALGWTPAIPLERTLRDMLATYGI